MCNSDQTNPENEVRRTIKFSLLSNQTLSFKKSIYLQTIKQRGVSWPLLISANQARRQILRIHLLHQLFLLFQICFLDISEFCLLRGLFEYFYQCRCDRAVRFSTTLAAAGRNAPYYYFKFEMLSLHSKLPRKYLLVH